MATISFEQRMLDCGILTDGYCIHNRGTSCAYQCPTSWMGGDDDDTDVRPVLKILDLFCCAGGCAAGYYRAFTEAGYDVQITGVDLAPQPRYPYHFVQGDAISYAAFRGWQFDFIHASPPCQPHSEMKRITQREYLDLVPLTRFVLHSLGLPYVIENVEGARKALRNPITLCGGHFGLKVYRHRLFESNLLLTAPDHVPHNDKTPSAGRGLSPKGFISVTGTGGICNAPEAFHYMTYASQAMGIDWMSRAELSQAVPPAYTHHLGKQLATHFDSLRAKHELLKEAA